MRRSRIAIVITALRECEVLLARLRLMKVAVHILSAQTFTFYFQFNLISCTILAVICETMLCRNDLTALHEAINAKLSAAEIKAQKLREEEIQKNK